jgi:tetratricopeptide (TPR) repeat protein
MGGYYHNSSFGFGHWALYDEMPDRKLWLWALSRNGGIWEDLLTDHHGQYMEFQAGRLLNQYSPSATIKSAITQVPFAPGVTDRWTEIWFPVKDIGGLSDVSPYGVLHISQENGRLQVGVNALCFADAVVEITADGKVIATEARKLKPMEVYLKTLPADPNIVYAVNIKGMDLGYTVGNKDLALKRPFAASPATPLTTAEALYREGVQLKEYREYSRAFGLLRQCLHKDSLHLGALAERAELYYRSGLYDSSLRDVNTVLRQDTYHPKANYVAGLSYKAKGDWVNALESLGWAARAIEFRSAAYAQMAAVCTGRADYTSAEHYARLALDFNAYNIPAWHALAVIHRKNQKPDQAREIIDRALAFDPLDHFAAHERFLLSKSAADREAFTGLIRNEQPHQTYLEIALEYHALGQTEDALALLALAPRHDIVILWEAFLRRDTRMFPLLINTSPDGVFPYRTETLEALTWATSLSDHWKFRYYLALNSYALQREDEAVRLLQACGDQPNYAPFYLTRSRLMTSPSAGLADLTRANRLAPGEWRTWKYIIDHYQRAGNYTQALVWAEKAAGKFKDNYTLGFDYAKALLNNARYDAAAKRLKTLYILPFEGSDEGHAVFEQATLGRALALMQKKKYTEALVKLDESKQWPEHLGVGQPYDADTRVQDHLMAYCYDKLGKPDAAAECRKRIDAAPQTKTPSLNPVLKDRYAAILHEASVL